MHSHLASSSPQNRDKRGFRFYLWLRLELLQYSKEKEEFCLSMVITTPQPSPSSQTKSPVEQRKGRVNVTIG